MRNRKPHGPVRDQPDLGHAAILHLGGRNALVRFEQASAVEIGKAPFDQRTRRVIAFAPARRCGDHHDQPPSIALRTAQEPVTRLIGEAGLDAVRTRHNAADGIVVVLANAVIFQPLLAHEMMIFRRVAADHRAAEGDEIACGDEGLPVIHPAVRRVEMAIRHAEPRGRIVHRRRPARDRTGGAFGQHDRCVIGRNGGDPVQQFIDRDACIMRQVHGRSLAVPGAERVGPDSHHLLREELAALHPFERHHGGHDLGDRGGHEAPVLFAREQGLPARQIDEHGDRRFVGCRNARILSGCGVACRGGRQRANKAETQ